MCKGFRLYFWVNFKGMKEQQTETKNSFCFEENKKAP